MVSLILIEINHANNNIFKRTKITIGIFVDSLSVYTELQSLYTYFDLRIFITFCLFQTVSYTNAACSVVQWSLIANILFSQVHRVIYMIFLHVRWRPIVHCNSILTLQNNNLNNMFLLFAKFNPF